jgi:hypothetical protein
MFGGGLDRAHLAAVGFNRYEAEAKVRRTPGKLIEAGCFKPGTPVAHDRTCQQTPTIGIQGLRQCRHGQRVAGGLDEDWRPFGLKGRNPRSVGHDGTRALCGGILCHAKDGAALAAAPDDGNNIRRICAQRQAKGISQLHGRVPARSIFSISCFALRVQSCIYFTPSTAAMMAW